MYGGLSCCHGPRLCIYSMYECMFIQDCPLHLQSENNRHAVLRMGETSAALSLHQGIQELLNSDTIHFGQAAWSLANTYERSDGTITIAVETLRTAIIVSP
jgi:hypothetical protein